MRQISEIVSGFDLEITEIAKDQLQYQTLPAIIENGVVTIRWKLTWKERFEIFFHGDLWLQIRIFNKPLQPVKLNVKCLLPAPFTQESE